MKRALVFESAQGPWVAFTATQAAHNGYMAKLVAKGATRGQVEDAARAQGYDTMLVPQVIRVPAEAMS